MLRALHPFLLGLSTLLVVSLHGCMVGPDYKKPDLVTNDSWHSSLMAGLEKDEDGPGLWWREFNDPILDTLIQRAQTNNLDLRTFEIEQNNDLRCLGIEQPRFAHVQVAH